MASTGRRLLWEEVQRLQLRASRAYVADAATHRLSLLSALLTYYVLRRSDGIMNGIE